MPQPSEVLAALWNDGKPAASPAAKVPKAVREAVSRSINSPTKTYRYVLPTQLLAKLVDPTRDARAVQEKAREEDGLEGAFDARSFCNKVVVPFDRENHNVLGGSADPYVNNPLRIAAFTDRHKADRKNAAGYDDLKLVLEFAQVEPSAVEPLLRLVLVEVAARLGTVHVQYPTPNRISLDEASALVRDYLSARSGGRRLQAVSAALFDTVGALFGLYNRVEVGHINTADVSKGDVADLACQADDGRVVLSVEVKDRRLTILDAQNTARAAREAGVAEILYLIRGGVAPADAEPFRQLKDQQFRAGHNLYEADFGDLLRACLILFGEAGRRAFLEAIARRIDEFGELVDRTAWRDALSRH